MRRPDESRGGQLDSLFYELSSNAHVLQRWWDHGVPDRHLVFVVDGVAQKGDGVFHALFEMVNSRLIPSLGLIKASTSSIVIT
jgi:hypothetical protein